MTEPLFPIRSAAHETSNTVFILEPYRHDGAWVFDDPLVGLVREPFVAGITEMIDFMVARLPTDGEGVKLLFADHAFEGYQTTLTWVRSDPVEGNWYRSDELGTEGWLCPALFCYFRAPPEKIFLRVEQREE